eukprot:301350-Prymnesium_polylepis.3
MKSRAHVLASTSARQCGRGMLLATVSAEPASMECIAKELLRADLLWCRRLVLDGWRAPAAETWALLGVRLRTRGAPALLLLLSLAFRQEGSGADTAVGARPLWICRIQHERGRVAVALA